MLKTKYNTNQNTIISDVQKISISVYMSYLTQS